MNSKPSHPVPSGQAPESFVVRIYRRDARTPSRAAGTVELIERGTELSFKNLRELQRILAAKP